MNAEHQLKSKLTWPVRPKSMKLKQNGAGAMNKAKNAVFIGLKLEKFCLVGGGWLLVGGVYCGGNFSSCGGEP